MRSMGIELAYVTAWEELKLMLIGKYYPKDEIQKLEKELWSLTMKCAEKIAYTSRFDDLAM